MWENGKNKRDFFGKNRAHRNISLKQVRLYTIIRYLTYKGSFAEIRYRAGKSDRNPDSPEKQFMSIYVPISAVSIYGWRLCNFSQLGPIFLSGHTQVPTSLLLF